MRTGQRPSHLAIAHQPRGYSGLCQETAGKDGSLSIGSLAWLQLLFPLSLWIMPLTDGWVYHSLAGDGSMKLGGCGVKVCRDMVRRSLEGGLGARRMLSSGYHGE